MMGPGRLRRLRTEYEGMRDLANRTERIHLLYAEGSAPERYLLRFDCRSLVSIGEDDRPLTRDHHKVEIYLTADFPRFLPLITCQTPIFHPNMDPRDGSVCVKWFPQQGLADLCIVLARMLQYATYESTSPLNIEAAMWAMRHRDELPIDDREVLTQQVGSHPGVCRVAAGMETPSSKLPEPPSSPSPYAGVGFVTGTVAILPSTVEGPPAMALSVEGAWLPFCSRCGLAFGSQESCRCPRCQTPRQPAPAALPGSSRRPG